MRTLTAQPGVETLGYNMRAFTDNLQSDYTTPIMEKYGIVDVDPNKWYPTVRLMDALNELGHYPDTASNMVAIGMQVGAISSMPPNFVNPTLEQVLMIWNDLYQSVHRNGDVGTIQVEKVGKNHYRTIHTDIYPDDFTYGILYGFTRRFLPPGTDFTVYYDPDITPRDQGGEEGMTVLHVEWE